MINTLIAVYGSILLISTGLTGFVWYRYRYPLIRSLFLFWLSGVMSFMAQGAFNNFDTSGILAFGINWMTVIFFLRIFNDAMELKLPFRVYHGILGAGLGLQLIAHHAGVPFQWNTLFFTAACAAVTFHGAFSGFSSPQNDTLTFGYRFLLVFDGVHFLDYGFMRPHADLAVFGFSITLIFFFCFATYVPVFILRRISRDYTNSLKYEVDLRTRQLRESNHQLELAFSNLKGVNHGVEARLKDSQTRLSALVHDISNPLQMLLTNLALITRDPNLGETAAPRIERCKVAVKSVREILTEAKSSHAQILGKTALTLNPVCLKGIVQDLLGVFEERLKEKSLTVVYDTRLIGDSIVMANEHWLKNQVLSNLLSNAIKFSHPGGSIRIETRVMENGRFGIRITDAGVGISASLKDKIFAFEGMTSSLGTAGEKGTGLGLPIVKQYAHLMGGDVHIRDISTPGACFEVELDAVAENRSAA